MYKFLVMMLLFIFGWATAGVARGATVPMPVPHEYDCGLYANHMWYGSAVRAMGAELKFEYVTQAEADRLAQEGTFDPMTVYIALDGMGVAQKEFVENTARVGYEAMSAWMEHNQKPPDRNQSLRNFYQFCQMMKTH